MNPTKKIFLIIGLVLILVVSFLGLNTKEVLAAEGEVSVEIKTILEPDRVGDDAIMEVHDRIFFMWSTSNTVGDYPCFILFPDTLAIMEPVPPRNLVEGAYFYEAGGTIMFEAKKVTPEGIELPIGISCYGEQGQVASKNSEPIIIKPLPLPEFSYFECPVRPPGPLCGPHPEKPCDGRVVRIEAAVIEEIPHCIQRHRVGLEWPCTGELLHACRRITDPPVLDFWVRDTKEIEIGGRVLIGWDAKTAEISPGPIPRPCRLSPLPDNFKLEIIEPADACMYLHGAGYRLCRYHANMAIRHTGEEEIEKVRIEMRCRVLMPEIPKRIEPIYKYVEFSVAERVDDPRDPVDPVDRVWFDPDFECPPREPGQGLIVLPERGLPTLNHLLCSLINVINWLIRLAPILGGIMIVVAGIMFMISTGEPGKITQARNALLAVGAGLIIIFGAPAFIRFFIDLFRGG